MKKVILSIMMMMVLGLSAYAQRSPSLTKVINSSPIDTVSLNGSDAVVYDIKDYDYNVLVVRSKRGVTLYRVNNSDVLMLKQYGSSYTEQLERI